MSRPALTAAPLLSALLLLWPGPTPLARQADPAAAWPATRGTGPVLLAEPQTPPATAPGQVPAPGRLGAGDLPGQGQGLPGTTVAPPGGPAGAGSATGSLGVPSGSGRALEGTGGGGVGPLPPPRVPGGAEGITASPPKTLPGGGNAAPGSVTPPAVQSAPPGVAPTAPAPSPTRPRRPTAGLPSPGDGAA
jgi:hypothetical protein